jgi:hypothetical protein
VGTFVDIAREAGAKWDPNWLESLKEEVIPELES